MKKIFSLICVLLILSQSPSVFSSSDMRVYVNGNRLESDIVVSNDRIYVPLRAVSEGLGASVVWNDSTRTADISFSEDDAVCQVVKECSESVVAIIGNYKTNDVSASYNNPTVHGSGVIYKTNGYILTNAHVVKDILNLTVVFSSGESLPGKVLFSDETLDLAIVKTDKIGLRSIKMADPESIVSGRTAIAIGTPLSMSMRNTVTKGIVSGSGVALPDSYYKLIQTDATVNPGNSGGALLNINGELVGINSSKFAGVGIENTAFAIPVDTVLYAIEQYEKYGTVNRAELDMTLEQSWEAKIGLPTTKGVTVKQSGYDSISAGDEIVAVNGIEVHSIADINEALKKTYNLGLINVSFVRNGTQSTVAVYSK